MVFSERNLAEPGIKIFCTEFVDISMAIDLDIVSSLYNVNTIEHVKKALSVQGDGELVVKEV